MPFVILTKSPQTGLLDRERIGSFYRRLFNVSRGPQAVTSSLVRGLSEIGFEFTVNPRSGKLFENAPVFVNESIAALKWGIGAKKAGLIKQLIAGPNLVVLPTEKEAVLSAPEIDLILQPSDWVRDLYISLNPALAGKIRVWPAGVELPPESGAKKRDLVLIFNKLPPAARLPEKISGFLRKLDVKYEQIDYGRFGRGDYFKALDSARVMIYLSDSESQGIALAEAWARNVPTLVYNRGYMEYNGFKWYDKKISAPYLSAYTGLFFGGADDFETRFSDFWNNLSVYTPRQYVSDNLTDKICAQKFLELVKL